MLSSLSETQCSDGGDDGRSGGDGEGRAELSVGKLVLEHSKHLWLLHCECEVIMSSVSARSCEIDLASVLFQDAVSLSERASQVFWRHNQTDRKRGLFDTRLEKRLLHGVCVEVINVLLEAVRDRDLLELFQRFDWQTFENAHHLHSFTR